jgi:hypothetical protein
MRRDAVPPPTAPSASSSSSLFSGGGGEQLFESGPSPLVFLPLLLIQGGGMDLSRVGEKLLSSVRSARSLGLPPIPTAPPPRPEVLYALSLISRLALVHCRINEAEVAHISFAPSIGSRTSCGGSSSCTCDRRVATSREDQPAIQFGGLGLHLWEQPPGPTGGGARGGVL